MPDSRTHRSHLEIDRRNNRSHLATAGPSLLLLHCQLELQVHCRCFYCVSTVCVPTVTSSLMAMYIPAERLPRSHLCYMAGGEPVLPLAAFRLAVAPTPAPALNVKQRDGMSERGRAKKAGRGHAAHNQGQRPGSQKTIRSGGCVDPRSQGGEGWISSPNTKPQSKAVKPTFKKTTKPNWDKSHARHFEKVKTMANKQTKASAVADSTASGGGSSVLVSQNSSAGAPQPASAPHAAGSYSTASAPCVIQAANLRSLPVALRAAPAAGASPCTTAHSAVLTGAKAFARPKRARKAAGTLNCRQDVLVVNGGLKPAAALAAAIAASKM
jgi:hypothetical protein